MGWIDEVIAAVMSYLEIGKRKVECLANKMTTKISVGEVAQLVRHGGGLHFKALCATIKQLETFSIGDLMQVVKQNVPSLWGMLDTWKMLLDLIEHGLEYFQCFWDALGEPEVVEVIPVVKTPITAAQSMEYMNSTVSGNINSVTGLLGEAGIHEPTQTHDPDMYQSKPKFRRMHQLITYSGIYQWLDCWLEKVAKNNPRIDSLDAFAATEPTFTQLKEIAQVLCNTHIHHGMLAAWPTVQHATREHINIEQISTII